MLASGVAKTVTYDTTTENDLVWGVGLGCHGVVHVLIEKLGAQPPWADVLRENLRRRVATELAVVWRGPEGTPLGTHLAERPARAAACGRGVPPNVPPPVALAIFGGGDDAQPLVRFAKELGWQVTSSTRVRPSPRRNVS